MDFLSSQNNILILVVAVASGIMLLLPAFTKGRTGRSIPTDEAVQKMNQDGAVLIDIRSADQFKAAHIAQAQNISLTDLESKTASFAKDKAIVVVCEHGRNAPKAVASLRKLGFEQVFSLEGGQQGWVQAGLPVKKS
ncbi:rhodanese-like domain-containing protein [Paenalcaligenes niemegkensis]|uniref:rhodanese-like domain-containing protein n=1 Tax=Paenalcaligenes niemegkensis TaxID=2895469 RepID=UPI001EE7BFE5|nr:rhodanese-like domain-containing protein [Paenalcaligenes niemegkensis]MCQ9615585.1 rhodanese-like domain-containing protein [Paenalcaligenes niemegkensis]